MANLVPVQVKGNVGTIEDNLDLVESSIREKVKEYSAVVVTEDTIKDGKRFLADIRKEKKALDDERKAIKSQWMAPYDAFEKRAKKIIDLYDEPVAIINDQLKAYEEDRKQLKRQKIQEIYDSVKKDLAEWLPLERIYNQKWENATYEEKRIREDMELIFGQMEVSISTIKSINSEFEGDALRVLKETGSLQSAISEINELQKQKDRFMEQARQEAERELLEAERKRQEAERKRQEEAERKRQEEERERLEEAERKRQEEERKRQEEERAAAENVKIEPQENFVAVSQSSEPVDEFGDPFEAEAAFGSLEDGGDLPFSAGEKLTVMVKVVENDFGVLKDFLDAAGYEYEVMR